MPMRSMAEKKKALNNAKDKVKRENLEPRKHPMAVRWTILAVSRSVGIFKSTIELRPMTTMDALKIADFVHQALPRKTTVVCPSVSRASGKKAIPWHAAWCFMTYRALWSCRWAFRPPGTAMYEWRLTSC